MKDKYYTCYLGWKKIILCCQHYHCNLCIRKKFNFRFSLFNFSIFSTVLTTSRTRNSFALSAFRLFFYCFFFIVVVRYIFQSKGTCSIINCGVCFWRRTSALILIFRAADTIRPWSLLQNVRIVSLQGSMPDFFIMSAVVPALALK